MSGEVRATLRSSSPAAVLVAEGAGGSGRHVEPHARRGARADRARRIDTFGRKQLDLVTMALMDDEPDGPMHEFVPLLADGRIVVLRIFAFGEMERVEPRPNSVTRDLTARTV